MVMGFCDSGPDVASKHQISIQSECFINLLHLILNVVCVLICVFLLIFRYLRSNGNIKSTCVHFRGHILRWMVTHVLIVLVTTEVAEGIISDIAGPSSVSLHNYIPHIIALLASVLTIIYYHNVEQWNSPRHLLVLLVYWISSLILKVLKGLSLHRNGLTQEHARVWLTWIGVALYFVLFGIEVYVIVTQKYAFFNKPSEAPSPEEIKFAHGFANFLSRYTFWWANGILIQGYRNPLELEALGKLPQSETAETQNKLLSDSFEQEKAYAANNNKSVSFWRFTFKAYLPIILFTGFQKLIADILSFVGPWCIEHIITYAYVNSKSIQGNKPPDGNNTSSFPISYNNSYGIGPIVINGTDAPQIGSAGRYLTVVDFVYNGYTLSVILLLGTLLQYSILNYYYFLVVRESIRYRTGLQSMIYDKALRLSGLVVSGGKMTVGEIVNHMSTDTMFLFQAGVFFHIVWSSPFTVIIAMVLMYYRLGISAVIGGFVVVLAGPLQYMIGKGMSRMQKRIMAQLDSRVKKTNEAVQGIKVIKLLAWEPLFKHEISRARGKEIKYLFLNSIFRIMFCLSATIVPALGTMTTFVIYPLLENKPLDVSQAISTLSLFSLLFLPSALFTLFCTSSISARVSGKRLLRYFLAEESESVGAGKQSHSNGDVTKATKDTEEEVKMELLAEYRSEHQNGALGKKDVISHGDSTNGRLESRTEPPENEASASESEEEASNGDKRTLIEINGGNFSWELGEENEVTLKNINVTIPKGKLTIIVGSVGAGKTSLVSAILGEMMTVAGKVTMLKDISIAYCTQKAWLQNTSLKNNILFGNAYSDERYKSVIKACALEEDIKILPAGDQTEIGEKGINLSGGQKQRISIARALYSRADTVILDDPFSALDAHVGKHVFEEGVIQRLLKRRKSVILVTHQLQYLKYAESEYVSDHFSINETIKFQWKKPSFEGKQIIVLKDGCVQFQGQLSDVKNVDPDLYKSWMKALREAKTGLSTSHHEADSDVELNRPEICTATDMVTSTRSLPRQISEQSVQSNVFGRQVSEFSYISEDSIDETDDILKNIDKDSDNTKGQLVEEEYRETGAVAGGVYLTYIKACGYLLSFIILVLMMFYQGMWAWAAIVISIWSEASTDYAKSLSVYNAGGATNNTTMPIFDNDHYIKKYVTLNMLGILGAILSGIALYTTTIKASKYLHRSMLDTILHVPIRFFDTNPTGRILNRFSSDMSQIDQRLPNNIENVLRCTTRTLSALVVNAIGTPFFLLAVLPLTVLYYLLQKFFRTSIREIKRLDSITKSPIYSFFSESLNGLQTIRAYRANNRFRQHAFSLMNDNANTYLYMTVLNQWLGIRLDGMGSVLVFIASTGSLSACFAGQTSPAYVGISITYALLTSIYFNWIVRSVVETELAMNCVERVNEYTSLKREPTHHPKGNLNVDEKWPDVGQIEFNNVSLAYDDGLPPVVREATFKIHGGEKIGICGRTGSGKSSLTLSIFRMIKICEGEIIIDGIDTARVPLPELRSRFAIIPQDPVLFTGTIRYNLDPAGEINDDQLWSALQTVQLKETIEALTNQLDSPVSEGGENFSVGQKQLFCLARAFLRNNKILVLDEATASIDLETDNKLQRIISTAFKNKTVITIAHRISTILKYDRVMVLNNGEVVEYDKPTTLMNDKNSLFHSLVSSSKK